MFKANNEVLSRASLDRSTLTGDCARKAALNEGQRKGARKVRRSNWGGPARLSDETIKWRDSSSLHMQALIAMSSATHFYRHTNASSQMLRSQTAEYVSKSTCTHSQMQTHAELTYHKKKIMKGLKRRWMDDKKGWGQGQRYKNRKGKMIIYKRNLISTLHKSLYLDRSVTI